MDIYNNYSIGKIYLMIEQGNKTPEVLYLNDVITKYISDTTKRVDEALKQLPDGTKADVMKWINRNIDPDIQYYVRCEWLKEPYSVIRKNNGAWKNIADIGVTVLERECCKNITDDEWLARLKRKATDISTKALSFNESHAHYDLKHYDGIRDELMKLLHDNCVKKCIIPSIRFGDIKRCMELYDKPEYSWIYYAVGAHPKYIGDEKTIWDKARWSEFRRLLKNSKCCAVGEIGLDYSYEGFCEEDREFQKKMFINFIDEANNANLPIILHIRPAEGTNAYIGDAHMDAINIIEEHPIVRGGVLHCFGGDKTLMEKYMSVGVAYFGIGARALYMQELDKAIIDMPNDSFIIETDSPYIRLEGDSMPNTSLTLYDVADQIANLKGLTVHHVADMSEENFERLFELI